MFKMLAIMFLLMIISFINALLLAMPPAWFNPFAGTLIAAAIPAFGVMVGVSFIREKHND